MQIVGVLCWV